MIDNTKKDEILRASIRLINEKGLQNTSTTDIAKEVGIARGTLYHYYKTKEDIIDALVLKATDELFDQAVKASKNKELDIPLRIAATVQALNLNTEYGRILLEHINKEENLLLHHRVQRLMMETLPQIFTGIIREGIDAGIFTSDHPYEDMELMVNYISNVIDGNDLHLTSEEKFSRLYILLENMEKILSSPLGYLRQVLSHLGKTAP